MKSLLFIINPKSGTDKKIYIRQCIGRFIDTNQYNYKIRYTEYAGHAEVIAREAVEQGIDIVVATGGDGTINEVARALIHTQTALAIIPCGSGNGLARHLQIPMDPIGAIKIINAACIKPLDFGIMNDTPFFCTCGMGFDAFVSMKFAQSGKRGLLSYIENTLKETLKYEPDTYTIQFDDQKVCQKAFVIACANASQYGNNAFIAPFASMSDGLMDITMLEPFTAIEAPQLALQLFNGTLHTNSRVKTYRAKHITITRTGDAAVHCDGDPLMTGQTIDIRIEHQGINIVVNPAGTPRKLNLLQVFSDQLSELPQHMQELQADLAQTEKNIKQLNKSVIEKLKGL
jgi:YegS/Rv2252/BmrU family lipid kinase